MSIKFNFLLFLLLPVLHACGERGAVTSNKESLSYDTIKPGQIDSSKYIPKPTGWVNDYLLLFTEKEKQSLDSLISAYEKASTTEIAVATIDSTFLGPIAFDAYTLLMLRTWGVGKKEKNNGILIVIAPTMRRVRIQNGYGIEKILTNKETAAIIETTMLPAFRTGNYYEGTRQAILKIIARLEASR